MTTPRDLTEPLYEPQGTEPDLRQEFEFGLDLSILETTLEHLINNPLIHQSLRGELASVLRAIKGCHECKQPLGDMHSGSCPTGGNRVALLDLDYSEPKPEAIAPF